MGKQTFNPDGLPVPKGSYFQVVVAEPGRVVGIAGQTASDGQGGLVGVGDIRAQTREVLRKIRVGVESVGGGVEDIISVSVFITDARFYSDVNEVRREEFGPSFPVSTMVQCVSLAQPGLLVEINAIAVVPEAKLTL